MDIGVAKYQIESRDDGYEILDEKLNSDSMQLDLRKAILNLEIR